MSTHGNHDEEEESGDYYFEEDSPDTHYNKDGQDEHIDNEHNVEASHDEHGVEDSHDEHDVEDTHDDHNNEDGHDEYTTEDDHDEHIDEHSQDEHKTSEDVHKDYEDSDNSLKTRPHGEDVEAGSGARFDDEEEESGVTPGLVLDLDTSDDEDLVDGSGSEQAEDTADMVEEESDGAEDRREELSEEETRARSEFFSLHGLDPLSLDMSCMETFVSGELRVAPGM